MPSASNGKSAGGSFIELPEPEGSLTREVIGAAFEVHNQLGCGLPEALYERAFLVELASRGLHVERQVPCEMTYKGTNIGKFHADVVVERLVVVELKSCEGIVEAHRRQVLNYARMLKLKVGLVINFGAESVEVKRVLNNPSLAGTTKMKGESGDHDRRN
jgi:GxxExxY protein